MVKGADILQTTLSTFSPGDEIRADGTVQGEEIIPFKLDIRGKIIEHPDEQVDLCAIAFDEPIAALLPKRRLKHFMLSEDWFVPDAEKSDVRTIESIVMVGYPNGLWDKQHNRPVARVGITAGSPFLNWNGRRQFLIDMACFPGSSGSPVFLYTDGMYREGPRNYAPGVRAKLIGVLSSGPYFQVEGRIVEKDIPTVATDVPIINSMMNLGYVIHADAIADLVEIFRSGLGQRGRSDDCAN